MNGKHPVCAIAGLRLSLHVHRVELRAPRILSDFVQNKFLLHRRRDLKGPAELSNICGGVEIGLVPNMFPRGVFYAEF